MTIAPTIVGPDGIGYGEVSARVFIPFSITNDVLLLQVTTS